MAMNSHEQTGAASNGGELNFEQLDHVVGGAGLSAPTQKPMEDGNAQMLTDMHLHGPNALQPTTSTTPGVSAPIVTGTHVGGDVTQTAVGYDARIGAQVGVSHTEQSPDG